MFVSSERFVPMSFSSLNRGDVKADVAIIWKRLRRHVEFTQCSCIIPFNIIKIQTKRGMAFAQIWLQAQSFERFVASLFLARPDRFKPVIDLARNSGKPGMGKGKVGIDRDRLLKKVRRGLEISEKVIGTRLI